MKALKLDKKPFRNRKRFFTNKFSQTKFYTYMSIIIKTHNQHMIGSTNSIFKHFLILIKFMKELHVGRYTIYYTYIIHNRKLFKNITITYWKTSLNTIVMRNRLQRLTMSRIEKCHHAKWTIKVWETILNFSFAYFFLGSRYGFRPFPETFSISPQTRTHLREAAKFKTDRFSMWDCICKSEFDSQYVNKKKMNYSNEVRWKRSRKSSKFIVVCAHYARSNRPLKFFFNIFSV